MHADQAHAGTPGTLAALYRPALTWALLSWDPAGPAGGAV